MFALALAIAGASLEIEERQRECEYAIPFESCFVLVSAENNLPPPYSSMHAYGFNPQQRLDLGSDLDLPRLGQGSNPAIIDAPSLACGSQASTAN